MCLLPPRTRELRVRYVPANITRTPVRVGEPESEPVAQLHLVVVDEAHAAVHLNGVPRHSRHCFAQVCLGVTGQPPELVLAVKRGRFVGEVAARLQSDVHIRALVLQRLERSDRLAELDTILRIRNRQLQRSRAGAEQHERNAGAAAYGPGVSQYKLFELTV